MDFDATLTYPAPPDRVFAMLTDVAFVERKAAETGSLSWHAQVTTGPDGGAVVTLQRVLPPRVPDFVRKFIGDSIDVRQTDTWGPATADGSRGGSMDVVVSGAPVTITGALALTPDGAGGTVQTLSAVVRSPVPLVGSKIEKAVAEPLMLAARKEEQVGRAWLQQP